MERIKIIPHTDAGRAAIKQGFKESKWREKKIVKHWFDIEPDGDDLVIGIKSPMVSVHAVDALLIDVLGQNGATKEKDYSLRVL